MAMPEIRMSLEEYKALVAQVEQELQMPNMDARIVRKQLEGVKVKRKGTPNPKMARALKKANKWGRTRSGKLRKGVSQGDIMRKAHALRRKM